MYTSGVPPEEGAATVISSNRPKLKRPPMFRVTAEKTIEESLMAPGTPVVNVTLIEHEKTRSRQKSNMTDPVFSRSKMASRLSGINGKGTASAVEQLKETTIYKPNMTLYIHEAGNESGDEKKDLMPHDSVSQSGVLSPNSPNAKTTYSYDFE